MDKQILIVVVDCDKQANGFYQAALQEIPYTDVKVESHDLTKGLGLIKQLQPHIVILNLYPSAEAVLAAAKELAEKYPKINLFITSTSL